MTVPTAIPAELQALAQWVIHRDKVPLNPHTGAGARCTDPTTWGTWDEARRAARRFRGHGLSFALSPYDPFVALDLDHCLSGDTLAPWAATLVARLPTYTERSLSGTGLHLWVRGTLPPGRRRRGDVEMYDRARFMVMTGEQWGPVPTIADHSAALAALHAELFPTYSAPIVPLAPAPDLSDAAILRIASGATNGAKFRSLWRGELNKHPSASEADLALLGILSFYTTDPGQLERLFTASARAGAKWHRRPDYRARSIAVVLARPGRRFGSRAA